jgi:hypothetical protein
MAGFFYVRSRTPLTLEQIKRVEQVVVIDRTPRTPTTGTGYGTMLLVGEFEDGPFNTPTEVFGASSEEDLFGGFGYTYGDQVHENACARTRLGQLWNGNAFIKGKYLKPPRKIVCRVDTSVGDVRLTLAAALRSNAAPFNLEPADVLDVTTDVAGPAGSTPVAAAAALVAGGGFAPGPTGFGGGEQIGITIDDWNEVIVSFQAADQTAAQVVARINGFLGTVASVNAGEIDIAGFQRGTGGQVVLRDVTDPVGDTTLIAIGHASGTTAGTGNVANVDAVTAAEAAVLINSGAVTGISGVAVVDPNTQQVIVYRTGSAVGTIRIDDSVGTMATDMGFTTATVVTANVGDAFTVPAGVRVRNAGGDEWVIMRSLSWPEGTVANPNTGTEEVEVRPALDDGTLAGAIAGTVTTIVDYPADRFVEVTNDSNLSAALTPNQIDSRYVTAIDATRPTTSAAREVTTAICAYRSSAVVSAMRQNAIDASNEGNYGRIFYTSPLPGTSLANALTDVVTYRRDRVIYTWPAIKIRVNEIAEVGAAAGGTGFTDDGIITIPADGPRAYIDSVLPPEENGCQDTGRLGFVEGIEDGTGELNQAVYEALKAAGICGARIDEFGTFGFQSDVTTELTPGRTTGKRRKFADYAQDSLAQISRPYAKRLATDDRVAGLEGDYDSFLSGLLSSSNPQNSRIKAYGVANESANNPDLLAQGILYYRVEIQQHPSIDAVVIDTQIGEGVLVVVDNA